MRKTTTSLCSLALALSIPLSAFAIGAIAVDDEQGRDEPGYGYVTGVDTQAKANVGALRECRKAGNKNCNVVVWFEQCGAYAASTQYAGVGYGKSQRLAGNIALKDCGHEACKVIISACE